MAIQDNLINVFVVPMPCFDLIAGRTSCGPGTPITGLCTTYRGREGTGPRTVGKTITRSLSCSSGIFQERNSARNYLTAQKDTCLSMSTEFYAFGELLWDCLPSGRHAGGAPFNAAAHLVQLGASASPILAIGRDSLAIGDDIVRVANDKGSIHTL